MTIGKLNHPPGQIIQQLIVNLTYGSGALSGGRWPVYYGNQPDTPDDSICVFDTIAQKDGRSMVDGVASFHYGVQLQVRSANVVDGYIKTKRIATAFDQSVRKTWVTLGSSVYSVHSISRTSDVISLGPEVGVTRRYLCTLNMLVALRLVTEEEDTGTGTY